VEKIRRDDLLMGPKERAIQAVEAGRTEDAIKYIKELHEDFKPLQDKFGEWIQSLLAFISTKIGEDAVEEALHKTFLDVYKERYEPKRKMTPEELVKVQARVLRLHYNDFYVEEDDEKFVLVMSFCGSGGRIQKLTKADGKTKKAYPWSFNQKGLNYFCCHCKVFELGAKVFGLDMLHVEHTPLFDENGNPTGKTCRQTIYKKNPHQ
jgi:hypothetical protein